MNSPYMSSEQVIWILITNTEKFGKFSSVVDDSFGKSRFTEENKKDWRYPTETTYCVVYSSCEVRTTPI